MPWSVSGLKIAVLLPCFNEEAAIAYTIDQFRKALPTAEIFVYDNNSTDNTAPIAKSAGAVVRIERMQGKGNVVRRMFADIDADVYVLADGDATYDPTSAATMIKKLLSERLDMVVAVRVHESADAYRTGHVFGNRMMTLVLAKLFGRSFNDLFSGYRVFSRRFVKSFPTLSVGFEIETEMSVHALRLAIPVSEIRSRYSARLEGSTSKLSTYRDGWRILLAIIRLLRLERPIAFFGTIGALLAITAFGFSVPIVETYFETGLVPRIPTALLVVGMMVMAALSSICGLILDTVVTGRTEIKRLAYLSQPPPPALEECQCAGREISSKSDFNLRSSNLGNETV